MLLKLRFRNSSLTAVGGGREALRRAATLAGRRLNPASRKEVIRMFDFKAKPKAKSVAKVDGKSFLAQVRESFGSVFSALSERSAEYDSLEDFLSSLEDKAWQAVVEPAIKASYKNGRQSRR
jgi:hypothetical protein